MTEPLPSWVCLACRTGLHDLCDRLRACECVVVGVDRTVTLPRLILCPGLERR